MKFTHMLAVVLIKQSDILDDFLVTEVFKWLLPRERQDLPQDDGKRPHVTFCAKLALRNFTSVMHLG